MNKNLTLLERLTALLTVFLLPTQLALHFWPSYSFVFGIRIDYLSPSVYLSDILIVLLFLLFAINKGNALVKYLYRIRYYAILLLAIAALNTLFSISPPVSLYKWLKVFEACFLGIYIYLEKKELGELNILRTIFGSGLVFSFIGVLQFFMFRTTGLFYLLGERTFDLSTPGIALTTINGNLFLRAYSTFPHPNALAGFLGVVIILLFSAKRFIDQKLFYFGILLISFCFFLTFSLSAWLAMLLVVLFYSFKILPNIYKKLSLRFFYIILLFSLFLPIVATVFLNISFFPENVFQRLQLSWLAGKMIAEKFLFGEGLGTFVISSTRFSLFQMRIWLLQPVHNLFLLIFSETGIVGTLFSLYIILKAHIFVTRKNIYPYMGIIFFVLFTGSMDHYWITSQQNYLLLALITGFSLPLND